MRNLDQKLMREFLRLAGERLEGSWVLIGGTLLAALEAEYRATTDIDVVGIEEPDQRMMLKLMELASDLGLPIETINQAAGFFLLKIPDFKKHLLPLHEGKKAKIYRPDVFLYIQLKLGRLSDSDLEDCIAYLRLTRRRKEVQNPKKLTALISRELKKATSSDRKDRLARLAEAIQELSPERNA